MAGHVERCSFVLLAFILGEGPCPCFHHPKKEAVCAGVLSGWPRDRLVITSVSLSGPVCPPTAGLTYLIIIDRPLVCIQTHAHTHTNRMCAHRFKFTCSKIALLMWTQWYPHSLKTHAHTAHIGYTRWLSQTNSHWFGPAVCSHISLAAAVRCGSGSEGTERGLGQVVDMQIR